MTGLDEFKLVLKEFRGLSLWAVGGAAAVPFAAALADFSPPWPPGIVLMTAIFELVALVVVFQIFRKAKRGTINAVLLISVLAFAGATMAYLYRVALYTYTVPTTKERFVKGDVCTQQAVLVHGAACPDLGIDELRDAEYEAERLWTNQSIARVRMGLVGYWCLVFSALSAAIGSFLVFQMRTKSGKLSAGKRTAES